jgi:hypothetical protein
MRRGHKNVFFIATCYKCVKWIGMAKSGVDRGAGFL